jgi:hypothetical protein
VERLTADIKATLNGPTSQKEVTPNTGERGALLTMALAAYCRSEHLSSCRSVHAHAVSDVWLGTMRLPLQSCC